MDCLFGDGLKIAIEYKQGAIPDTHDEAYQEDKSKKAWHSCDNLDLNLSAMGFQGGAIMTSKVRNTKMVVIFGGISH